MAKKHIVTSVPLFQVDNYSSGISDEIGDIQRFSYGDVSRTLTKDPYWDEIEAESNQQTALDLDKLIPANAKTGTFIVEKSDSALHLGIVSNTNESGLFVNWLNFGESSKDINFLCGTNCFSNWERDQWAINKLAIAPQYLIDKFLNANPTFSLKNENRKFKVGDKIVIPDSWEDLGGLWDTYPQYWLHNHEACFYDGENIFTKDKHEVITDQIKKRYLSPRWYLSHLEIEAEKSRKRSVTNKELITQYKIGKIYLHSSGKKARIQKLLKSRATGLAEVYFEGESIVERIAIADLFFLPVPQCKDFANFESFDKAYQEWLNNCDDEDFDDSQQLSSNEIWEQFLAENQGEICLDTLHSLQVSEALNSELSKQEQGKLSALESSLKITQKPNECLVTDSPELNNIQILEIGNQDQGNTTSIQSDFPAQVHQSLATAQDLNTQNLAYGLKPSGALPMAAPVSPSSKILQDLSITDFEQFLGDSEWLAIVGTIRKSYQHRNSALPMKESDYSSLPTPTTYPKGSGKCRPAGTNRLEQKLRPYIAKGDKLHPAVPGWMMGFPVGWVEQVLADTGDLLSVQPPLIPVLDTTLTTAATALTSTVEQLHPNKPALHSKELSILPNSLELSNPTTPTTTTQEATEQGAGSKGEVSTILKTPIQVKRGQGVENRGETSTSTITKIKAVTLHQPWASFVGIYKWYETRGKATNYRGKIAIHAAVKQKDTDYWLEEFADFLGENVPYGAVVAIADLTDCIKMTEEFINQQSETELRCGLWKVGRYAWKLENVVFLPEPIPARGMPGLWDIELELPITSSQESGVRSQEEESKYFSPSPHLPISPSSLSPVTCHLSPVTCHLSPITKPEFKTGDYVLNGRVGQVIEDSPGEYFTVKYAKNDLKCYFWGQDDQLIEQLAIVPALTSQYAPQHLIDQFLRENLVTELCRSAEPLIEPEVSPKKKTASGSLAPFTQNKQLKSGRIATYPKVVGERDKLNYAHWMWGYYYEIKINGEWKNKSLLVPARIAPLVREMIDKNYSVEQIKSFILQCKNKKAGVTDT